MTAAKSRLKRNECDRRFSTASGSASLWPCRIFPAASGSAGESLTVTVSRVIQVHKTNFKLTAGKAVVSDREFRS